LGGGGTTEVEPNPRGSFPVAKQHLAGRDAALFRFDFIANPVSHFLLKRRRLTQW
jgi:hypothetical protein